MPLQLTEKNCNQAVTQTHVSHLLGERFNARLYLQQVDLYSNSFLVLVHHLYQRRCRNSAGALIAIELYNHHITIREVYVCIKLVKCSMKNHFLFQICFQFYCRYF